MIDLLQQDSTIHLKWCQISQDWLEESVIAGQTRSGGTAVGAIVSLVFAEGRRPDLGALEELAREAEPSGQFAISHAAPEDEGWAELLALGLTFDCFGLAPGPSAAVPPQGTLLGLHDAPLGEVLTLAPAPHLADAPGLQPAVRTLAGITARLAKLPGVLAVVWHPAHAWMLPSYFTKIVDNWLAGGPFPALGLTTLERDNDGSIYTRGLALMTGQELRFAPDAKLGAADFARIGVRLIHALIEVEPLEIAHQFTGPDGETIDVVPVPPGHSLRVTVRR